MKSQHLSPRILQEIPSEFKCPIEIRWNFVPSEVQYYRGVPLRPLSSKEAKAPRRRRIRMREGEVQPQKEAYWDAYVMDFESYAAHFALSPECQAEVAHRAREDAERNADKQAAVEAKRVADEIERVEKERIDKKLKEATAA